MVKNEYFENLDGLRFLSFLSVFLYHSFHTTFLEIKQSSTYIFFSSTVFGNGNLGVNFFFVLSGFLITYLLIQEKKHSGKINIKYFWIRRILRIWPLFYFCVFFGFIIFPILKTLFGGIPNETAHWPYYIVFLNNFDFIKSGLPDSSILGVLWSIAIEEQFYFIWPIILIIFPVDKYWIPFTSVVAVSLIFRFIFLDPLLYEFHTLSCISDMAVGAFGAWMVLQFPKIRMAITLLPSFYITSAYVILVLIYLFRKDIFEINIYLHVFERLIIASLFLFIILEQNYAQNSLFKLHNYKIITRLGVISYGLYCLHFVGILSATNMTKLLGLNNELWQVLILDTVLGLGITIFVAQISYKFIESPFLRIKKRYSYNSK